ncbi:MAG: biopolymer transporter ExbD [Paludibacteraceae bacterium]|nr:biopolymer transporter ExbD [Paludibacteraceae bacterium]MBN2787478.1 biopolymer transporter ExbD [Paludibacteraceae bacterium]
MSKRAVPEINASSMADISFLLLIFFLVTTSMAVNKGLTRKLPPPIPKDQPVPEQVDVNKRNVFVVLINSQNQLMVQGKQMDIKELRTKTKEFIKNEFNDVNLPVLTQVTIKSIGTVNVTKDHVISLQNDRGTDYQAYLEVQNELVAAYNELRDELAKEKFGTYFNNLEEESQNAIQKVYPQKISEAEPKNYGGVK